jgi:adenine/guanine phosphoribosyltransferase-like PRPP-binding protein
MDGTEVWQEVGAPGRAGVQPGGATWIASLPDGRGLLLPIRALPPDGARGVASLILNQASFALQDALADIVADRLRPHRSDVIAALPTLGLSLGEAVARRLGHRRMVAMGTSAKFWYDDALSVPLGSITSPSQAKRLWLDPRLLPLLGGAQVALVDDVLSSGASIAAGLALLARAGCTPVAIGAAMLQGAGWRGAVGEIPVAHAFVTPILRRGADGWVPE